MSRTVSGAVSSVTNKFSEGGFSFTWRETGIEPQTLARLGQYYSALAGGCTSAPAIGGSGSVGPYTSGSLYRLGASTVIGSISPASQTYYDVKGSGAAITFTGTGEYLEGSSATITATANDGYVLNTFNGESVLSAKTTSQSATFASVNSDITVVATAKGYYNVKFDRNRSSDGTSRTTYTQTKVVIGETENLMLLSDIQAKKSAFTNPGFAFKGWNRAKAGTGTAYADGEGVKNLSTTAGGTVTLYAQWGQCTLTYDANGGDSTPAAQTYYGDVTLAGAITRPGRNFLGWKIGNTVYQPGDTFNLVEDATAVAQWSTIRIINEDPAKGTISLVDVTDYGRTVATENASGELVWNGEAGHSYRVVCVEKDILYAAQGVYVDGAYENPYEFSYADGEIEKTFTYAKKTLYSLELEYAPDNGGTAAVVDPAEPHEVSDGKNWYVAGTEIVFSITPAEGYASDSIAWKDAADGKTKGSTSNPGASVRYPIGYNTIARFVFSRLAYDFSASVDEASASALSVAAVREESESAIPANRAYHGNHIVFTATMAAGFEFAGWYDSDGVLVSNANPYRHEVTGEVALAAKAKVACSLGIDYPEDGAETCTLTVNGEAYTPGVEFHTVLGESFSYSLALGEREAGENWQFDGWFSDPADTSTVLPYAILGTVAPIQAFAMAARVRANAQKTLTVYLVNMGETSNSLEDKTGHDGAVTLDEGVNVAAQSGPRPLGGGDDITPFVFNVAGTQYVRLNAAGALSIDGDNKSFYGLVDDFQEEYEPGNPFPPDGNVISRSLDTTFLLNANRTVYVFYGQSGRVETEIAFANISDSSMGEIAITGSNDPEADIDATGRAATAMQGNALYLTARAKNGYKFAGWYASAEASGDATWPDADATVTIVAARTIYALFVQDRNAVCVWEGSNENMMVEWISKTYEGDAPFNPSALRVDSLVYPPESVKVEMFSSPDAAPTQTAELALSAGVEPVRSQDARRLPFRRPERFLRIGIKHTAEVDALIVSTSMGGLKQ